MITLLKQEAEKKTSHYCSEQEVDIVDIVDIVIPGAGIHENNLKKLKNIRI